MDQYPVSTCQRATIVASYLHECQQLAPVWLSCLPVIFSLLLSSLTTAFGSTFFVQPSVSKIMHFVGMVNSSLHQMGVTIDHNLMMFSRNTELITWHDILSSLLTGGPYDSGFLCNQNKDLLTINTTYMIFILWVFLVHVVFYFV